MIKTKSNSTWLLLLPLLGAASGCFCQAFPLPGEGRCPTDARRIYPTAGEEAVRRCPCGADPNFYGHKPTNWRVWPQGWRCGQYPYYSPPASEVPMIEPLPPVNGPSVNVPQAMPQTANPFQDGGGALPLQPMQLPAAEPEIDFGMPPQAAPLPPQAAPAQPTPQQPVQQPPVQAAPVEPAKPPAAQTNPVPPAAPGKTQDWRSAADVINSAQTGTPPTSNEPPTPGEELNPPVPPGTTPAVPEADKGSSKIVLPPASISAQNNAMKNSADGAPAKSTRLAEHLTHNLFK